MVGYARVSLAGLCVALAACGHVAPAPKDAAPTYSLDYGDATAQLRNESVAGRFAYALYDVDSFRTQPVVSAKDLFSVDVSGVNRGIARGAERIAAAGYDGALCDEDDDADTLEDIDWGWNSPLDEANDYANAGCDDSIVPLAVQMRAASPVTMTAGRRAALEGLMTGWVEKIRTELAAAALREDGAGSEAAAEAFAPVAVRIGGSGLNVTAKKGARVIEVSPDVLRALFSRAVFRATRVYADGGGFSDIFDMADGDAEDLVDDFTPPGLHRYFGILANLSGFRLPYLEANAVVGWLDGAMGRIPEDKRERLTELHKVLDCMANPPETDSRFGRDDEADDCNEGRADAVGVLLNARVGEAVPVLREAQAALAAYAPDAPRDTAFARYLDAYDAILTRAMESEEETLGAVLPFFAYLTEATQVSNAVGLEMQKSLLFLMSHELYHAWIDDLPLKSTELAADVFATRAYNKIYPEVAQALFAEDKAVDSASDFLFGQFQSDTGLVEFFMGRAPDVVFADVYRGTQYFEGSVSHPPFPERLKQIRRLINENALEITGAMTQSLSCMFDAADEAAKAACPQLIAGANSQ